MSTKAAKSAKPAKQAPKQETKNMGVVDGAGGAEGIQVFVAGGGESLARGKYERPQVADVNKQWFVDRMRDVGLSLRALGRSIGMDVSPLSVTLAGRRKMTADEAGRIAHCLRVPVEDVLTHAGVDVRGARAGMVNVRYHVGANGVLAAGPGMGSASVPSPVADMDGLLAIRAVGGPFRGSVFYYRQGSAVVRPEAIGRICVITTKAGCMELAWLRQQWTDGTWELSPLDSDSGKPRMDELTSAWPVQWIRQ